MKIAVFVDSSVVYKLMRTFLRHRNFSSSKLLLKGDIYHFIMSEYVFNEVQLNLIEDGYCIAFEDLDRFLSLTGFQYISSGSSFDSQMIELVFDKDDTQILQDTYISGAKILLTENLRDFRQDLIYDTLHIQVLGYLP